MPRVVRFSAPRAAEVVDEAPKVLPKDGVRLRTLFSGISAGTELTAYRGSNPYLAKRWDESLRLFVDGTASREYPLEGADAYGALPDDLIDDEPPPAAPVAAPVDAPAEATATAAVTVPTESV